MNIEQQQIIAEKVYDGLSMIDPHCILAGGAPRDWYYETTATDLDFYFYTHTPEIQSTQKRLIRLLPEFHFKCDSEKSQVRREMGSGSIYAHMKNIRRIWDGEYQGLKVQLIQMVDPQDVWNLFKTFSVSICEIEWHPQIKGGYTTSERFKLTDKTMTLMLNENGYNWDDPHPKKIWNKFTREPFNFSRGTKEQIKDTIVRNYMRDLL